jgi:hypothetical protein
MQRSASSGLMSIGVVLALCLGSADALKAATPRESARSQAEARALAAVAPGEVQAFRDQFNEAVDKLVALAAMKGGRAAADPAFQKAMAYRQGGLTDGQVALMVMGGADLRPLSRAVDRLADALGNATAPKTPFAPGSAWPAANYPSCTDADYNTMVTAYDTLKAAKEVWSAACRPLQETEGVIALGEGAVVSLDSLCIPLDVVLFLAELTYEDQALCNEATLHAEVTACYDRLQYLHDTDIPGVIANDNTNASSIISNDNTNATSILSALNTDASNIIASGNANTASIIANATTNTSSIITNGNTNTSSIIANSNTNASSIIANSNTNTSNIIADGNANTAAILAAIQQSQGKLMSMFIEANLASSSTPMGVCELPLSKGGQLETARNIVTNLIASMQSLGLGVGNAPASLSQGNTYLSSGKPRLAYTKYRAAYQAATNPGN